MENESYIKTYFLEAKEIIEMLEHLSVKEVSTAIEILFDAWKNGRKVFTMGNGGSASTASHFAGDLLKTVVNDSSVKEVRKQKGFKSICLNDNPAAFTAWVNDAGWENVYCGQLNTLLDKDDVVIIISVHGGSGWSGNLIKAAGIAKERGAKIIGLAGFDGGMMKTLSNVCLIIPRDSTPHVEALHGVLQHLIVFRLKEMIENYEEGSSVGVTNQNQNSKTEDLSVIIK